MSRVNFSLRAGPMGLLFYADDEKRTIPIVCRISIIPCPNVVTG